MGVYYRVSYRRGATDCNPLALSTVYEKYTRYVNEKLKLANEGKGVYNSPMIARVSASQEDYLEVIYDLSHGTEPVRSIDIANLLGVSRASVNKRLSLLKDSGFIEHEPYGLVRLTDRGSAVAKNVRERHNTLYKFLTDILGVPEETADREACEMEHAISQDTADKLYAYLHQLDKAPSPEDKVSKTQRVQNSYDRLIK